MLLGEYQYTIDQKGRIAIPSRFRDSFRDGLVLARGFDRCILVYPLPGWIAMAEKRASLPATRGGVRRGNRFTFAGAYDMEMDKQGRVLIPLTLRDYGQVKNEVVVIGVNTYLEIWAKELWENEKAVMDESNWQIGESIDLPE